jgi:hypothetical protein
MSLVPRRSLRPSIVLAFVSLALAIASVVEARVIVIRADGSGDVATFQAGIDALLAEPSESEPDTLLVEPGRYDEDVSMEPTRRFEAAIVCPAGPDSSEVRSLRGFSTPIDGVSRLTVRGLTVRDRVGLGIDMPKPFTIPLLLIQNCRFMGEVEIPRAYGFGNGGFIGCDFRGRLSLGAAGYHLSHCRFTGQTARLALYTDFFLNVEECVFSGADTAVVTVSNQSDNVYFEQCQFSDVGTGIAVTLDPVAFSRHNYWGVYVKDCRFENITGAAILVTPVGPPPDFVRSITTYVTGSHFDHCGSAIDGRESPPLNLFMEADTVLASSGSGVQASVAAATLQRVMIRGSGEDGARLTLVDGIGIAIQECHLFGNAGDGLRLIDGRGGSADAVQVHRNSSLANRGAGIRLGGGAALDPTAAEMTHNLVAGNTDGGLVVEKAYDGRVEENDAWLNERVAFAGVRHGESNFEFDPQLCDPSGEDLRLASTSPCAPLGPHGQIGAFGIGCDRMGVAVDALPKSQRPINRKAAAPVSVAILGRALFDAGRVDAASVRANGVSPAPRGNGTNSTHIEDVNRDGHADLLMTFDGRTLPVQDNQLKLEGQTIDGAFFQGGDQVTFKPGASDTSQPYAPEPSTITLVVPSPQRADEFQLQAAVSEGPAARLEMFDVTGRRILSRNVQPEGGAQGKLVREDDLRSGVYLVRMSQLGASVTRRVVLTK